MKTLITRYSFLIITIVFISCKSDDDTSTPPEMEETINFTNIEGDYVGKWSSTTPLNTYDRIPMSMRITASDIPGKFRGQFFFTASFVSCCNSGSSDGSILIEVEENTIKSFVYNDILPNCNGRFEGDGFINENGEISISFAGNDCEGDHTGGLIRMSI
jgi:hypothetical protein